MASAGSDYAEPPQHQAWGAVGWLGTAKGRLPAGLSRDEKWALIFPYRRGGDRLLGDRIDAAIEASSHYEFELREAGRFPDWERQRADPDLSWEAWPPMFHSYWHNRGFHDCELCQAEGEIGTMEGGKRKINLGIGVYLLKTVDERHAFSFPRMLGHYVRVHGYLPPPEFIEAFERWFPAAG